MFDAGNATFNACSLVTLAFFIFVMLVSTHNYKDGTHILPRPPSVIAAPSRNYCQGFRYLVAVYTRVNDAEVRLGFRQSYGFLSLQYNFTVLFPLGTSDAKSNQAIMLEHHQFGDILQANFHDSYRNLTRKSYSLANFVRENCTSVRAVLKIDDDVEWNVRKMFEAMNAMDFTVKRLYCQVLSMTKPIRTTHKWSITAKEYPGELFPPYCTSVAYVASPSTYEALYRATSMVPHMWVDDVFSTGIVGAAACVSHIRLNFKNKNRLYKFLSGTELIYIVTNDDDRSSLFNVINGNASGSFQN